MKAGLLEKESTGGATARIGFEYQDAYVLQHLPQWMAQSAFSHVVSEAIGDVEVCYFTPSGGVCRVMYEAKNTVLTASQFWDEIVRFKAAFETSPKEYVRFVLVCRDYNNVVKPMLAKIARLRGVGASFQSDSVVLEAGRQEVIDWAVKNSYRKELAEFSMDFVDFVAYTSEHAESAFSGEWEKHLPTLDLSAKQVTPLRDRCKTLIARSSFGSVFRKDIEDAILEVLGAEGARLLETPSQLHLSSDLVPYHKLGLLVAKFNGPGREHCTALEWKELFAAGLRIGEFIHRSTARRCIAIDGKQRMSMACLLGYVFSAARGFTLQVGHNGLEYRTDVHARGEGVFFIESVVSGDNATKEGVACIGFPTTVGPDLSSIASGDLSGLPSLTLESNRVVDGIGAMNLAVSEAKAALVRFRSESRLTKLHLFIKAPSSFAMVLGHRLNGVADIQLYDWIDGRYLPTAALIQWLIEAEGVYGVHGALDTVTQGSRTVSGTASSSNP